MRFRRLLLLGLPLLVVACGDDAPDMGSADLSNEQAAAAAAPVTEATAGVAVGEIAAATTTTTTTTTTVPEADVEAAGGGMDGEDPVQALCDRVQILKVTAAGLGPDLTAAERATLVDGVTSISAEVAALSTTIDQAGATRLSECMADLATLPV